MPSSAIRAASTNHLQPKWAQTPAVVGEDADFDHVVGRLRLSGARTEKRGKAGRAARQNQASFLPVKLVGATPNRVAALLRGALQFVMRRAPITRESYFFCHSPSPISRSSAP